MQPRKNSQADSDSAIITNDTASGNSGERNASATKRAVLKGTVNAPRDPAKRSFIFVPASGPFALRIRWQRLK
jgi:hypothetical protein